MYCFYLMEILVRICNWLYIGGFVIILKPLCQFKDGNVLTFLIFS